MRAVTRDGDWKPETVLSAHRLSKRYSSRGPWALHEVSIDIKPGFITAIVGPNGAGKSTLIRSWMGFERPSDGTVAVAGVDPWRYRERALINVGYVSQGARFYRALTVDEHIEYAESLRAGFDARFVRDRMRGLGVRLEARALELSGGQQAQLSLAIALGTNAPLLILDEPLASLDPLARREFMRVLMDVVGDGGRTAVLSSHVVADVEEACDQVVLLIDGEVILDLEVSEVIGTHYLTTDGLAQASDRIVGTFSSLSGQPTTLVRGNRSSTRSPPNLEHILMGYLAATRSASQSRQS